MEGGIAGSAEARLVAVGSSVTKKPGQGFENCKRSLPLPHLPGDICEGPSSPSLTGPICATRGSACWEFSKAFTG